MQNQNQQGQFQMSNQMPAAKNHGGHEMFDAHEAINSLVGCIEHGKLYEQYIQDTRLKAILQRQTTAITEMYNTIIDTFQSGQDPKVPTKTYEMNERNSVLYGMKETQPKSPAKSVQDINDECISGFMMGNIKAAASGFTMTAMEVTNPVLRRLFADSIPNLIEMAYEIFLYQNKNQYYQVPQLKEEDMQIIMNSYAAAQNKTH